MISGLGDQMSFERMGDAIGPFDNSDPANGAWQVDVSNWHLDQRVLDPAGTGLKSYQTVSAQIAPSGSFIPTNEGTSLGPTITEAFHQLITPRTPHADLGVVITPTCHIVQHIAPVPAAPACSILNWAICGKLATRAFI